MMDNWSELLLSFLEKVSDNQGQLEGRSGSWERGSHSLTRCCSKSKVFGACYPPGSYKENSLLMPGETLLPGPSRWTWSQEQEGRLSANLEKLLPEPDHSLLGN